MGHVSMLAARGAEVKGFREESWEAADRANLDCGETWTDRWRLRQEELAPGTVAGPAPAGYGATLISQVPAEERRNKQQPLARTARRQLEFRSYHGAGSFEKMDERSLVSNTSPSGYDSSFLRGPDHGALACASKPR